MAEVIHEGHYEEQKVYKRPSNTYLCDFCNKEMGTDKGIVLGFMGERETEHGDHDIGEEVNFCSFSCLHKFPNTDKAIKFERQIKWCDTNPDFYINRFSYKDLSQPNPRE